MPSSGRTESRGRSRLCGRSACAFVFLQIVPYSRPFRSAQYGRPHRARTLLSRPPSPSPRCSRALRACKPVARPPESILSPGQGLRARATAVVAFDDVSPIKTCHSANGNLAHTAFQKEKVSDSSCLCGYCGSSSRGKREHHACVQKAGHEIQYTQCHAHGHSSMR